MRARAETGFALQIDFAAGYSQATPLHSTPYDTRYDGKDKDNIIRGKDAELKQLRAGRPAARSSAARNAGHNVCERHQFNCHCRTGATIDASVPSMRNAVTADGESATSRCEKLDWTSEEFDHTPYDTDPCCTPEGIRCKHGRWQHKDRMQQPLIPDCERKNLVSILKWFKKIVTGDWFVSFGTLLGAVRSSGFIPKDTDIDLSLDAAHADIVEKELRAAVGCTHFVFQSARRPWTIQFSKTNRVRARGQYCCAWRCCA